MPVPPQPPRLLPTSSFSVPLGSNSPQLPPQPPSSTHLHCNSEPYPLGPLQFAPPSLDVLAEVQCRVSEEETWVVLSTIYARLLSFGMACELVLDCWLAVLWQGAHNVDPRIDSRPCQSWFCFLFWAPQPLTFPISLDQGRVKQRVGHQVSGPCRHDGLLFWGYDGIADQR